MIRLDMHCHSDCSDGSDRPEKLAKLGKNRGLALMALTDHDTVEGVEAFLAVCRRLNVRAVSGIEISADYPSTMHILGYCFDVKNQFFRETLENLQRHRDQRNVQILVRFNQMGIPLTMEEVQKEAGAGVVGRPHFAKALIRRGIVHDMATAFQLYLGRGGRVFVKKQCLSPKASIDLIRQAGGVAALAHPIQTSSDMGKLQSILRELKELGLWGLECYSGHHNADQVASYCDLARSLGLEITAGSDYHGQVRPGCRLGVSVPEDRVPLARRILMR